MIPELLGHDETAATWPERRKEIIQLLSEYEYGFTPKIQLDQTVATCQQKLVLKDDIFYEARRLFFKKDDHCCSMRFELYLPVSDHPLPIILMIDCFDSSPENIQYPELSAHSMDRLPFELLAEQGFAAAFIHVNDICNDDPATYKRGIMEIAPREGESGWGAIGAWAWGTSRVVDYVLSDARFDAKKIIVLGVSRCGKTALWCGAQDERIGYVISTVSGCGGASILRGKTGEHIRNMASQFPHWTCPKYAEYADNEDDLPIDQHMLLAAIAPRPLYISDAIEDDWADPHKAFESAVLAGDAYRLLGKKGLEQEVFPNVDEPLMRGDIAYHVRHGAHGLLRYDWEQYLAFLEKYQ